MSDLAVEGGCLCGQCRYRTTHASLFVIKCFCRDCQSVSGGGHLPQVAYPADAVTLTGPVTIYRSTADSGSALEFGFCGHCGSPLSKTTSKAPDKIFLTAGSHDDPSPFTIDYRPFEEARHPWDGG